MAVRSYRELKESIKKILEGRTEDEIITLLEDLDDSESSFGESKRYQYDEDMDEKIANLDDEWRKRYTARFYFGDGEKEEKPEEKKEDIQENIKIEDLFKEVK